MQIEPSCAMYGVKGDVRLSEGQNHPPIPIPISPGDSTSTSEAQDCYSQPPHSSNTPQDVPDIPFQVNAPPEVMDTTPASLNTPPSSPSETVLSGISDLYIDEFNEGFGFGNLIIDVDKYDVEYYDIGDTPVMRVVPIVDLTVQPVSVPDDYIKEHRDGEVVCVYDGVNTDDTFKMIQSILNEVIDSLPIEINAPPYTGDFINYRNNFDDNIPDCQSLKGHLLDHNKYPYTNKKIRFPSSESAISKETINEFGPFDHDQDKSETDTPPVLTNAKDAPFQVNDVRFKKKEELIYIHTFKEILKKDRDGNRLGRLKSKRGTLGIYKLDPFLKKEPIFDKHGKRVTYHQSQLKFTKTCKDCPCLSMFNHQYGMNTTVSDEDVNFPPDQVPDISKPPPNFNKSKLHSTPPPH